MSRKDEVFAIPIWELELKANDINLLVSTVQYFCASSGRPVPVEILVGDVVEALGHYRMHLSPGNRKPAFLRYLADLGLSRVDCVLLPRGTTSFEALQRVPHQKLLRMSALVLDVPSTMLYALLLNDSRIKNKITSNDWVEKKVARITVEELLTLRNIGKPRDKIALSRELRSTFAPTVVKVRDLLLSLGFDAHQYALLNFGNRTQEVLWFQRTHNLSMQEAEKLVTIARREGLLPDFL